MTKREQQFVDTVWHYYRAHGRHDLPWRHTADPYRIVVSEVMLQQTQVARVQTKYKTFLRLFPNTKRLAEAPFSQVVTAWQGLGYNRRAQQLQRAAQTVHTEFHGRWPRQYETLMSLQGIGPYTAGAVMAFAYNQPAVIVETNIRTVFLHHFWPTQTMVSDAEILAMVERTLPETTVREWYWALMDYGAYLKTVTTTRNQQSKHYRPQSPFKGSRREVRGAVVRLLSQHAALNEADVHKYLANFSHEMLQSVMQALLQEELIVFDAATDTYRLPH